MFCALIPALILQCGTTVAAAIIVVFTPTIGSGHRSLGYIIYGVIAIVVMLLAITSTIFARISETRDKKRSPMIKGLTAFIAVALRRISFSLAFINATGVVAISCFQITNFLDNCYCDASAIGYGMGYYIIAILGWWDSRIAGTALSAASIAIYVIFLVIASARPATSFQEREHETCHYSHFVFVVMAAVALLYTMR